MRSPIRSLHHVTATADDAQADLDFFARDLGLRLVKKTVNFDNPGVYHFYYGDEVGTPGTIWTTFPYKDMGVPVGIKGTGQVTTTSFSVPEGTLDYWRKRLGGKGREGAGRVGTGVADRETGFGEEAVRVTDASGMVFDLIENKSDTRAPWTGGGVDGKSAVRGIHSVTMTIRDPDPTIAFLKDMMGFSVVNETEGRTRLGVGGTNEPGKIVEVVHDPDGPAAKNGLGTVHHVAFAVDTARDQLDMRAELIKRGYKVTEVMDRQYFTSIYFREPGGVLYEIATVPPGFGVDESTADLGKGLKLPPWEEPRRARIESVLPPVTY